MIFSGTDDTGTNPLAWLRKNFTKDTWNLGTIDFGNFKSAVGAAVNSKDLGYLAFLYEKIKDATTLPSTGINWVAFLQDNKNIPANDTEANKVISNPNTFTNRIFRNRPHLLLPLLDPPCEQRG